MGTYTKNLKLETPNYTDNADIPALAKKNNEIIDSEMIKRANGLDYNEQTGVLQLTGNNSKVGSPIQIKNNLPVTSMASGIELKVNNYKQLIKFSKEGKTEQKSYIGKNILDYISNLKASSDGLTSVINDDGSITTSGKPTSNYKTILNSINIIDILEDGETYTFSQSKANDKLYMQINAKKKDGTYSYYSLNDSTKSKQEIIVNKSIYETYTLNIQTGLTSNWGESSLTITNKYMFCKGTDTAGTSFEPYVGGIQSPNPDYPQEIENISGVENLLEINCDNQNEKGIELINNNDGSVTLNGTSTAKSGAIRLIKNNTSFSVKNLPSEVTFSLSEPLPSGVELAMAYGDENGSWVKNIVILKDNDISKSVKLDIPNNAKYIRFNFTIESGIVLNNITFRPLLEKGNKQHYFVPNGSNYLQLENVGKNILNIDETPFTVKKITSQGNVLYWSGYSGVNDFVKVKEKTTYKFSSNEVNKVCYIDYYDKNKNYLSRTGTAVDYFTTPENCKYIKFAINLELIPTNAQLMEGTIIKPYEPYQKKIINIDLKGNNLCSNKDKTIKDELVIENGKAKINKKFGEYIFTGNEIFSFADSNTRIKIDSNLLPQLANVYIPQPKTSSNRTPSFCTHYILSSQDNVVKGSNKFAFSQWSNQKFIYFPADYSTIDEFKAKLKSLYDAGTPVIIQYPLAEPEVVDLGEIDFDLIENSTLTCEEESGMQIDYLTIDSNIFVQDSLDGNSNQKAPSIDAIKKYFGKKVYDKDANGWIKIEFFDHIEYVYTAVVNKTFNSGWGYTDNVPFPVGVSSLGDRILTSSVICTDAAIKLNAGQYHNGKQGIGINYTNSYETALTKECIYDFRILEYK